MRAGSSHGPRLENARNMSALTYIPDAIKQTTIELFELFAMHVDAQHKVKKNVRAILTPI